MYKIIQNLKQINGPASRYSYTVYYHNICKKRTSHGSVHRVRSVR